MLQLQGTKGNGKDTQDETEGKVEGKGAIHTRAQKGKRLVAEGGEGGEATTKTCGEQKPGVGRQAPRTAVRVKQTDKQATRHICHERGPGELHKRTGCLVLRLATLPKLGYEVTQYRTQPSTEKDIQIIHHLSKFIVCFSM